jgi:hypothetical protein
MVWRNKCDIYITTKMHNLPTNDNFHDEHGNATKPRIIRDYNRYMGYVQKGHRTLNSYMIQRQTWKWAKKLFFHLPDSTTLNSFLLLTSCAVRMTQRQFRLALVRNLIERAGSLHCPCRPMGRPMVLEKQATSLVVNFSNHWIVQSSRLYCCVCSSQGIKRTVELNCTDCDVGLCTGECFETYHTKNKAWCNT